MPILQALKCHFTIHNVKKTKHFIVQYVKFVNLLTFCTNFYYVNETFMLNIEKGMPSILESIPFNLFVYLTSESFLA